ncbi:MAG: NUDIX domain-containing protein [Candidatus Sungbacteria bacterium]|nr:NUDIX domain-containing protein [bacterium]MDZ4260572.1 NUDIX domain-containing protein [Candidatus Sungbacteria bacterium]
MPVERSAGAVIYRETKQGREYLLLCHQPIANKRVLRPVVGHWSFAKGHVEKGETTEQTVRREIKEETGITQLEFIPDFKETIRYFVNYNGEKRLKFVAFFLVKTSQSNVTISFEHQGFNWLDYERAYKTVTYSSDKKVLKAADQFLVAQKS